MYNSRKCRAVAYAMTLLLGGVAFAAEKNAGVKAGAKDAGRAVGSAVREIGQGVKEVGKTIGHAAKEGVDAAKEGGREFKKAVKGEK